MTTRFAPLVASAAILLLPGTAFAYVGPGAGLTMIGALWAVILAVLAALFFVVAWPVRRMLRQARHRNAPAQSQAHGERTGGERGGPSNVP